MMKKILLLGFIFCSLSVFAQTDLEKGFIVLKTNDTITGALANKNYYSKVGVKLYQGNQKNWYSKRVLSEIHVDNDVYVKSDLHIWVQGFFKKEVSGNINLYTYKKTKRLGGFDTDIGSGLLISALKFYCSDYPNLTDSIKSIDKKNVDKFVLDYNDWKLKNPESKSFFEKNIHRKPLINFKLSFLLPGAGFEIGLNDNISINAMLKNEFGYGSSVGWIINPFLDTQLRYYHNINKRREANKRTYKYSGNYICLVDGYFFDTKATFIGFEYGWQRVINKYWYYNVGIGAARWMTENKTFTVLSDLDFGYNF